MPSPAILSALIGLANAAQEHPEHCTPDLHTLIREALCADADMAQRLLPRLQEMKHILLPDCAKCPHPCGRTADFDLTALTLETPAARAMKEKLILALPDLSTKSNDATLTALRAIGEYRRDENLQKLLDQLL